MNNFPAKESQPPIAKSFGTLIPIPGHDKFVGLGPRPKEPNYKDLVKNVSLGPGQLITIRWILNGDEPAWNLPSIPEYKRFVELVCAYMAKKEGFKEIHIRSAVHKTTVAMATRNGRKIAPGDFDWHITADLGRGSKDARSAHFYVGKWDTWSGLKENVNCATMGIWRPEHQDVNPLPSVMYWKIRYNSQFSNKKGRAY